MYQEWKREGKRRNGAEKNLKNLLFLVIGMIKVHEGRAQLAPDAGIELHSGLGDLILAHVLYVLSLAHHLFLFRFFLSGKDFYRKRKGGGPDMGHKFESSEKTEL